MSVTDYIEWFVNRTKQYKRYKQMLTADSKMAVMLIEAPTGMGKTFLVKKMRHQAEQQKHPIVHIDFRTRRPYDTLWLIRHARQQISPSLGNPAEIFSQLNATINQFTSVDSAVLRQTGTNTIIEQSGQPPRQVYIDFHTLRTNLAQFDEGEVRTLCFDIGISFDHLRGAALSERLSSLIQNAQRLGVLGDLVVLAADELPSLLWWEEIDQTAVPTEEIEMAAGATAIVTDNGAELSAMGEDARKLALAQINRAFRHAVAEAQEEQRLVILIDSFEDHTDEAEDWLHENVILPIVDQLYTDIMVIIAGQNTPDYSEHKPLIGKTGLAPFTKEHVREYLVDRRNIVEEDIDKIYTYCRGMPGILATMADMATLEEDDDDDW